VTSVAGVVVIGIGNQFRGDDGAGPAVVARLAGRAPAGVQLLISDGEPTRLLEAWTGAAVAVVVDTVAGDPGAAGLLHRVVVPGSADTGPDLVAAEEGLVSSHGFGLGTAIELGRVLGRMPARLVVHCIGGCDFGSGAGLSPAVAAGLDDLAAAVLADATG
jgi:hydrogenase maturation protease